MKRCDARGDRLEGIWTLVSSELLTADGRVATADGPQRRGLLVYHSSGWVAAQVAPAEEGPYLAYFGRFHVEPERRRVVHRVVASANPAWAGMALERRYAFGDGRLSLFATGVDGAGRLTSHLAWERADGRRDR